MANTVTFRRGTTPTIRINQGSGVELSNVRILRFTLEQGATELTKEKSNEEFDDASYVDFVYTQEETLGFSVGTGKMQCKAFLFDGNVVGDEIGTFKVLEILDETEFEVE